MRRHWRSSFIHVLGMAVRFHNGDTAAATAAEDRRAFAKLVLWCLSLGLILAWTSLSLRFNTRQDTIYNLTAVLRGEPFRAGASFRSDLPFYNRVLFPVLYRGLLQLFPFASESQWYLLLRIMSFQSAVLSFALVCRQCLSSSRVATVLAMAVLALATIASFDFPWEEPSDAFDLMVIALGVGAALKRRFMLSLGLSIVFAANRESAAFLGLIWFVLSASRATWLRSGIEATAICGLSYSTALFLKLAIGPRFISNYVNPAINLNLLWNSLHNFNPLSWLPMLVAVLILLVSLVDIRNSLVRRLVVLSFLLAGAAFLFGLVNEMRTFLPCFVLLGFAIAESISSATCRRVTADE